MTATWEWVATPCLLYLLLNQCPTSSQASSPNPKRAISAPHPQSTESTGFIGIRFMFTEKKTAPEFAHRLSRWHLYATAHIPFTDPSAVAQRGTGPTVFGSSVVLSGGGTSVVLGPPSCSLAGDQIL